MLAGAAGYKYTPQTRCMQHAYVYCMFGLPPCSHQNGIELSTKGGTHMRDILVEYARSLASRRCRSRFTRA